MNKISGAFKLRYGDLDKVGLQRTTDAIFIGDDFFFVTERISDSERNHKTYVFNKEIGVAITFIGEINNFSELCELYKFKALSDVDLLIELYRRKKEDFIEELNGLFTLAVYNLQEHKLSIFQDIFSSPINLYYCVSDGSFLFSTSLKKLLLMSGIKRELDGVGVINFLRKSCIPSEHTLIKNIYKLTPGQYLRITKNSNFPQIKLLPLIKDKKFSKKYYKKNYYEIFKRCVQRSINSLDEINIALSSGYDSNFLLYAAKDLTKKKIRVFTIGGKKGRDERKKAITISKNYQNVEPYEQLIDEKIFVSLPEIVWRQEDLIHLPSNFVKLQLAKITENIGCRNLICGDCCDEILTMTNNVSLKIKVWELIKSLYFVRNIYCFIKKGVVHLYCFRCGYSDTAKTKGFEFGPFRILKHVGIILNSFSIGLRLPYLDREFLNCAGKLRKLNKNKAFHHKFIGNFLPKSVAQLIQHLGGSIDEGFMFEKYKEAICNKFIKSEIANNYIGFDLINIIVKESMKYMNIISRTLYLEIFHDIFISGKYDYTFSQTKFNILLEQFLNN